MIRKCPICGAPRIGNNAMATVDFTCGSYYYDTQLDGLLFSQSNNCFKEIVR